MKKSQVKPSLVKELEKTPIISVACEKVGISRQTAYRWMKEDESFLYKVQEAMKHGVGLVNDVAESNILRGIKQGDKGDTKYWLSHRHEAFNKPFRHRDAYLDLVTFHQLRGYGSTDNNLDPFYFERKQLAKEKARAMLDKWKPYFPDSRKKK
jgi:hypothetical protein